MGAAAILGSSLTLAHVPDLVRYGSKPSREKAQLARMTTSLRSFDDAVGYPPAQVFIGNLAPEALWDAPRPRWRNILPGGSADGSHGHIVDQASFYALMSEVDRADLVTLDPGAEPTAGDICLYRGDNVVGMVHRAHD
jgi:hypothetical protein